MQAILGIILSAILSENFILVKFYGICPFMGVSKKIDTALGMGMAVTFVMAIASAACYAVNVLLVKLSLDYMQTVAFILVIAAIVQLVEMVVEKFAPALYNQLGIFLPLIAVNCAIMGASLFMQERGYANIGEATAFGLGSGIGWMLAIVGIAAIREKLTYSNIPAPLRGIGITFIVTGLMAISFMSFLGINL